MSNYNLCRVKNFITNIGFFASMSILAELIIGSILMYVPFFDKNELAQLILLCSVLFLSGAFLAIIIVCDRILNKIDKKERIELNKQAFSNHYAWKDIVKYKGNYFVFTAEVDLDCHFVNVEKLKPEEGKYEETYLGSTIYNIDKKLPNYLHDPKDITKSDVSIYDCDKYFEAFREEYGLDENEEFETYLFDHFELPSNIKSYCDISTLGGYINGCNY